MELVHYSPKPIIKVRSTKQDYEPSFKPNGLWVTPTKGLTWKDWCEGEQFRLDNLRHCFSVELNKDADILSLKTPEQIKTFNGEYKCDSFKGKFKFPHFNIDWKKVAEKYQGILIIPYQWSLRFDHEVPWYYGWDCASGCIWDAKAIKSIKEKSPASIDGDAVAL